MADPGADACGGAGAVLHGEPVILHEPVLPDLGLPHGGVLRPPRAGGLSQEPVSAAGRAAAGFLSPDHPASAVFVPLPRRRPGRHGIWAVLSVLLFRGGREARGLERGRLAGDELRSPVVRRAPADLQPVLRRAAHSVATPAGRGPVRAQVIGSLDYSALCAGPGRRLGSRPDLVSHRPVDRVPRLHPGGVCRCPARLEFLRSRGHRLSPAVVPRALQQDGSRLAVDRNGRRHACGTSSPWGGCGLSFTSAGRS